MLKEKLVTFEGRPLFPERIAETASYRLSPDEQYLYEEVTEYVRNGMNLADRLEGKRKNTVGFALTVLQRRLASSPEAIFQSLRRRTDRLERTRADLLDGILDAPPREAPASLLGDDPDSGDFDTDELDAAELEEAEEELVDAATAARTAAELETEIADLRRLTEHARRLLDSQQDVKWRELRGVIESQVLTTPDGKPRKLIVFTAHRDTLIYLGRRITQLLGRREAVVAIHGGVPRYERRRITAEFTSNPEVQILIATDAAGEGLNLQAAHLMVNYDLPWNPNRIEQRFGRIHRIGQTEVCRLWNLVAEDTREGEVFIRLLDKIEEQRAAYDGEIFNVLGTSLGDLSLTRVLRDAIRYGEQPDVKAKMWAVIDEGVSAGLQELLDDEALASEALAPTDLEELRRQMEDAKAKRLQPHFIRDAFLEAFDRASGRIERREKGRYEITHVPASIRERAGRAPVARRYERITFDAATIDVQGTPRAELLAPGHPLHDAALQLVIDQYGPVLDRGTVLTSDAVTEPTLLAGERPATVTVHARPDFPRRRVRSIQMSNGTVRNGSTDITSPSSVTHHAQRNRMAAARHAITNAIQAMPCTHPATVTPCGDPCSGYLTTSAVSRASQLNASTIAVVRNATRTEPSNRPGVTRSIRALRRPQGLPGRRACG